jgi:hypothetical protein
MTCPYIYIYDLAIRLYASYDYGSIAIMHISGVTVMISRS